MGDLDATLGSETDKGAVRGVGPRRLPRTGERVGRYVLGEEIGRGAMGLVYSAQDPELKRDVALKVLRRREVGERDHALLIAEARALAQLSSPFVVGVYDVGAPEVGSAFVAMELVDGMTLRQWTGRPGRTRAEILRVYADAARGLIAIHGAGVVHQDFKPDNVIVGATGRAKVADFGLARGATRLTRALSERDRRKISDSDVSDSDSLDPDALDPNSLDPDSRVARLTRRGRGTPAYMAPELWNDVPATPASDQFAYCVSLFEALLGRRPFAGETAAQIVFALGRNDLGDLSDLPPALAATLQRGLARDPAERFESIGALLAALEKATQSRRRRRTAALAVGAAGVAIFALVIAQRSALDDPCERAGAGADASWAQGRERVRKSLSAVGRADAEQTAERVDARLDAWFAELAGRYRTACRDAQGAAPQHAARHDLTLACLDSARAQGEGLIEGLARMDGARIDEALPSAVLLPDPTRCEVSDDAGAADPALAALREAILALRSRCQLSERGLDDVADQLLQAAERSGDPLTKGQAILTRAWVFAIEQELDQALEAAKSAHELGRTYDLRAVTHEAALHQGRILASRLELDRAFEAAEIAIALGKGMGPRALGDSEQLAAEILVLKGDGEAARDLAESAIFHLADERGSLGPRVAAAYMTLAESLQIIGDHEAARGFAQAAVDACTEAYGELHPSTLRGLLSVMSAATANGDLDEAVAISGLIVERRTRVLGTTHLEVAQAWMNESALRSAAGDNAAAVTAGRQAVAIYQAVGGPDDIWAALARVNLARALLELGRVEDATHEAQSAYDTASQYLAAGSPQLAYPTYALAHVLAQQERYDEALAIIDAGVRGMSEHPDAFGLALLTLRARVRLAIRDYDGAIEDAHRAAALGARDIPGAVDWEGTTLLLELNGYAFPI